MRLLQSSCCQAPSAGVRIKWNTQRNGWEGLCPKCNEPCLFSIERKEPVPLPDDQTHVANANGPGEDKVIGTEVIRMFDQEMTDQTNLKWESSGMEKAEVAIGLGGFIYTIIPPKDGNPCWRAMVWIPTKRGDDIEVIANYDEIEAVKEICQLHHSASLRLWRKGYDKGTEDERKVRWDDCRSRERTIAGHQATLRLRDAEIVRLQAIVDAIPKEAPPK